MHIKKLGKNKIGKSQPPFEHIKLYYLPNVHKRIDIDKIF